MVIAMTAAMAPRHLSVVTDEPISQERFASSIVAMLGVLNVSQAELARRMEMDATALSKALRKKGDKFERRLQLDEAGVIANRLGIPFSLLELGGDEIRRRALLGIMTLTELGPDSGPGLESNVTARYCLVTDLQARRSRPAQQVQRAA